MNWSELKEESSIEQLRELSKTHPVLIFKHSTRCSISAAALDRLERHWKESEMMDVKPYYLDLLAYRALSNKLQEVFHVEHQSPQILVIKNGQCIYDASHIDISYKEIKNWAK